MKKFGFTLAEVLITMGIVGIVAAIALPSLNKAIPDSNKAKVLKAYNTITNINQKLLNDPRLYPGSADCNVRERGISCNALPIEWIDLVRERYHNDALTGVISNNAFIRMRKYINLFAMNLEVPNVPVNRNLFANSVNSGHFMTEDGLLWTVWCDHAINPPVGYRITIDTNARSTDDNPDPNSPFDNDHQNPDQFQFWVDQFGRVSANDPMTWAYLQNPNKMNDRTHDLETARGALDRDWN